MATAPDVPADLLVPPAYRTRAAGSPRAASAALDARLLGFVGAVGQILAVLPPYSH